MRHKPLQALSLLGLLLAGITVVQAEAIAPQARVCTACHQTGPDGEAAIGPPLWGLAERGIAAYPGFDYSDGLKQHQGQWNAPRLDRFLTDPAAFAPGTRMQFPGLSDPAARAAVIAWLARENPTEADWSLSTPAASTVDTGPLQAGEGAELVAGVCSGCHSLHLVTQQGLSRDSWADTLNWMVEEQGMAPLSDAELSQVLDYLARHYGLE